jgi:hypothetical protein
MQWLPGVPIAAIGLCRAFTTGHFFLDLNAKENQQKVAGVQPNNHEQLFSIAIKA